MESSNRSDANREALNRLMPLVYQELRRIAEGYLRRESRDHTLQPTALIHEAYLRLIEYGVANYKSRQHFFTVAARVMRHILVDHARARQAAKRNIDSQLPLTEPTTSRDSSRTVTALDDALRDLAVSDPRKAELIELRFFGGMTADEISRRTGTPVHIVRRELRLAQAWLRREIESSAPLGTPAPNEPPSS